MKKILVIGSLNIDMVVNVDHTPVAGETILSDKMEMIPGGKGANQACAAGRLGAASTILGAIGDDLYGEMQKDSLKESGVDVSRLIKREGGSTGVALITVNGDGDNSIVVVSGANATVSREDIDENLDLIRDSDIILLQLEIPLDTVLYAAKKAKELGKTVILDPAPAPKVFPEELYRYVDVVKPNETELSILTGVADTEEHLEEAIARLTECGVGNVIVTLGSKGVYVHTKEGETRYIPAREVKAVDTTAAGDSFTAALAMMLAEGKTLVEAAEFANLVASIVVTRRGAQSSIPNIHEVDSYWKETKQ